MSTEWEIKSGTLTYDDIMQNPPDGLEISEINDEFIPEVEARALSVGADHIWMFRGDGIETPAVSFTRYSSNNAEPIFEALAAKFNVVFRAEDGREIPPWDEQE